MLHEAHLAFANNDENDEEAQEQRRTYYKAQRRKAMAEMGLGA